MFLVTFVVYVYLYLLYDVFSGAGSRPVSPGESPPTVEEERGEADVSSEDDSEVLAAGDPTARRPASPTAGRKRKASGAAGGKKRKSYRSWSFTDEQEEALIDWLQANTFLWLRSTKDYHRKNAEWEKKAMELGVSLTHLKNWWKNIKDWFVKLIKKTSGQATRVLTDRDRWILQNVAFYKSKYMSIAYIFMSKRSCILRRFFVCWCLAVFCLFCYFSSCS